MSLKWNVVIDEQPYNIEGNGRKLTINGEKIALKTLEKKTHFMDTEYQLPIGSKMAMLVVRSFGNAQLVIDGKDCATGEDYVPQVLPKWAYVFMVLHLVNFINGAIGVCLAIIGCMLTSAVSCNPKFNTVVKILLDLAILVVMVILTFGLAIMVAGIYY